MDEIENELLSGLWTEFSEWVEMLSFREIQSNKDMVRAIEHFERLLRVPNII